MKEKDRAENLLLVPLFFIAAGLAFGIGQAVFQWLGYESGMLADSLLIFAGILMVILAKDRLISFQKTLLQR